MNFQPFRLEIPSSKISFINTFYKKVRLEGKEFDRKFKNKIVLRFFKIFKYNLICLLKNV